MSAAVIRECCGHISIRVVCSVSGPLFEQIFLYSCQSFHITNTIQWSLLMNIMIHTPNLSGKTINASDFGMDTKLSDNSQPLQQAIRFCKNIPGCRLNIAPGTYRFQNQQYIALEDFTDFCLDGNNAEFIFDGPNYFLLQHCLRVEIMNLILDYNWDLFRPASLCKVIENRTDQHTITLEFPELEIADTQISISSFNQFDPVALTPGAANGKEIWLQKDSFAHVSLGNLPNRLILEYRDMQLKQLQPGEVYLARHIWQRDGCAFYINDSEHITLSENTIYSTIGMTHVINGESSHCRFNGEKIMIRPDSNRHMSTDGDGIHVIRSKGYLVIENCDFSGMGDDDVNIHDCHMFVTKQESEHTILLENEGYGSAGHQLEVRNPDFSPTDCLLTLEQVEQTTEGRYRLHIAEAVPEWITEGYMLINRHYSSSHYIIRNNYFHQNRARGLLLQCNHGRVEHNRFYRTQGAAIYVMLEALRGHWYEGSGVEDLVICNNQFEECNYADWSSVIDICSILPDESSVYATFRNIVIENNLLSGYPSLASYIANSDQVIYANNRLRTESMHPSQIILERCGNIRIENNQINGESLSQSSIVSVDDISYRKKIKFFSSLYQ